MTEMVATMTDFRGIGRIDQYQRHTSRFRLVGHKLPQLVEAPTVVRVALRLADLGALPNARQIFEGYLALGGLGLLDKLFTDAMVDRSHMALLPPRQPFQKPFGFLRAFGLERTSDLGIVGTQSVDLGCFIGLCVGINRDPASTKINAKRACGYQGIRNRTFELDVQQESTIAP